MEPAERDWDSEDPFDGQSLPQPPAWLPEAGPWVTEGRLAVLDVQAPPPREVRPPAAPAEPAREPPYEPPFAGADAPLDDAGEWDFVPLGITEADEEPATAATAYAGPRGRPRLRSRRRSSRPPKDPGPTTPPW